MDKILLETDKILQGYEAVSSLYPFIPPITFWRAWEYAAYKRYRLTEPVLDVGCGDGRFFNLVWPDVKHVSGVDIEEGVILEAQKSGIYEQLIATPANDLKFPDAKFASVFANCALEHMDDIDKVLSEIYRVLQPDGYFLFSIVTEKFIEWTTLPLLFNEISGKEKGEVSILEYINYHHLRNPFNFEEWVQRISAVGFELLEYIPILPENSSKLFLFMDQLWHVATSNNSELGQPIVNYLEKFPNFPNAMRYVLKGCLEMESDLSHGSGIVFLVKKPGTKTGDDKIWLKKDESEELSQEQIRMLLQRLDQLIKEHEKFKISNNETEKELVEAKAEIERLKGQNVSSFSILSRIFRKIGLR